MLGMGSEWDEWHISVWNWLTKNIFDVKIKSELQNTNWSKQLEFYNVCFTDALFVFYFSNCEEKKMSREWNLIE